MTLAWTGSRVEDVVFIEKNQLDELATHLCEKINYHEQIDSIVDYGEGYDEAFESQKREQGYCDDCRDHAGEILAAFIVSRREV